MTNLKNCVKPRERIVRGAFFVQFTAVVIIYDKFRRFKSASVRVRGVIMKVEHKLVRSTLYVNLIGELDTGSADYVRDEMDKLISAKKLERFIIDLSALEFMDSTGIGVLLGRYKKLKAKSVPMYLASPVRCVDKVLTLSGVYDIMPKLNY